MAVLLSQPPVRQMFTMTHSIGVPVRSATPAEHAIQGLTTAVGAQRVGPGY